jgi:hypothetical protein
MAEFLPKLTEHQILDIARLTVQTNLITIKNENPVTVDQWPLLQLILELIYKFRFSDSSFTIQIHIGQFLQLGVNFDNRLAPFDRFEVIFAALEFLSLW